LQVLSAIQVISNFDDHHVVGRVQWKASEEAKIMHDLMIALAFIGMVLAPAIVAAKTDIEATEENK
jgi:hypothetical protein